MILIKKSLDVLKNMYTEALVIAGRVAVLKPWMGHVCEGG